ncbi:MAG TPA: hypothetical protein VEC16_06195 [Alphaproteobacteria bacterium]|nr:hypothetical protein [Alphaproteobacteria bacterium]
MKNRYIILAGAIALGIAFHYGSKDNLSADLNGDSLMDHYIENPSVKGDDIKRYTIHLQKKDSTYITIDNVDSLKLKNLKGINLDSTTHHKLEEILKY